MNWNNKEEVKEYMSKWYQKNKDRIIIKSYVWGITNKKKRKEIAKRYNKKHRKGNREKQRKNREKHPERVNAYYRVRKGLRDNKCKNCGSEKNLEFPHIDYDNDKGFTLCVKCHRGLKNEV